MASSTCYRSPEETMAGISLHSHIHLFTVVELSSDQSLIQDQKCHTKKKSLFCFWVCLSFPLAEGLFTAMPGFSPQNGLNVNIPAVS